LYHSPKKSPEDYVLGTRQDLLTVRQQSPFPLLAGLIGFLILGNVLVAQIIMRVFYPGSGFRLGTATLVAIGVAALGCLIYTVVKWRAYFRDPYDRGT
jgi:hypothetical protein